MVGLFFCYRPPPRHNVDGMSKMDILKQIDYTGAFLSIGGVTLFLVGLQAGGYQFPWTSGKVLGPLIVGILMILGFIAWEVWGTKTPMIPAEIFQGQRVVALALAIVFVAGMNFYSILGFFPLMLEYVYTAAPITIGVRGLCYPIAILAGACITSTLMSYTRGHVRELFFVAAAIMTAFGGALAGTTPFNVGYAIAMATLDSFGVGAIVVPALTLALYACPDRYIGTTAALSLSVRFLGGSVGTAIYYNIFNTKIKTNLPAYVGKAAVQAGLPQDSVVAFVTAITTPITGAEDAQKVPGVTPQILQAGALAAEWAFNDSLKYVWYATIPFGIICMLCCLALPNIRQYMTNRVAVDIH